MKLALASVTALVCICSARAHPVAQGAMEINIAQTGKITVRVRVSPEEVFVANGNASPAASSLDAAYQQHADYLLRHLRLFADDAQLAGMTNSVSPPQSTAGSARAVYEFEFPAPYLPRVVRVEEDVLNEINYAPGNRWEASYVVHVQLETRPLLDGALLTSSSSLTITAGSHSSAWWTARDYVCHGIRHILTGYDHLLFISALALAVKSFWELFRIIAAFTLAHTITLTLSVLNIVRLPSHIVEPMIAASIVFVASQNVFWPRTSHGMSRLSVAFFFGLFHGLGFAGGLLDAMSGMPGVGVSLAILAFSVGVEIGHQCVVLPLFALTQFVARPRAGEPSTAFGNRTDDWFLRGSSAVISMAGMYYLIAALGQLK